MLEVVITTCLPINGSVLLYDNGSNGSNELKVAQKGSMVHKTYLKSKITINLYNICFIIMYDPLYI